jgi:hypothetical protein
MPGVTSSMPAPTTGRSMVASSPEQTMPSTPMSRACSARAAANSPTPSS